MARAAPVDEVKRRHGAILLFGLAICLGAGCQESADQPGDGCLQSTGAIDEDVVRFAPDDVACESLPASMALVEPQLIVGAIPTDWAVEPEFTISGTIRKASIPIEEGTSLYGAGELAGPLLRNGRTIEVRTMQPFRRDPPDGLSALEYDDATPNLYQAHPWLLAVRANGSAFGVLADTTYPLQIDLTDDIVFSAEEPFPVITIEGDSPQDVLEKLAELTGTIELPPRWALGYQQARWSYVPDTRVREIADEFRARSIPCDVIWVDIDYMDGFRIFTFADEFSESFESPSALNDYLHDRDFRSVWILDPGVKVDPGYFVYEEGIAGAHFMLDSDGEPFTGGSWPLDSHWPDYTRPETRAWWKSYFADFLANGIDGVWIDLNEPTAVFPVGAQFPTDTIHRGGGGLPEASHRRYRNVYGLLMAQATHEALVESRPDRRPFVLSRSNYLGGQRYAAMWTGDNSASWDHLRWSVSMSLNMGLSAQPFVGPDIGGFFGAPSNALYAHWIGVGALFPFSRTHTISGSDDQEPWSFGPEVEAIAKAAIERRYRLLPYLYTLFHEASTTGLPIWRPVFFADPADPSLRSEDHAFLLGADILVEPVLTEGEPHVFALPKGIWRPFRLVGEDPTADEALPVLKVRGGAIIPVGRIVQSTAEASLEPLTLLVSLDENGEARGTLYEDAGEGYGYRRGDYLLTSYVATQVDQTVEVRVEAEEGERERPERIVEVVVVTDGGTFQGSGPESSTIVVEL
jgi:alpha-glucosidase